MSIQEVINKKNNKQELSYEEIKFAVDNYVSENISDEDMTLLLKSILENDMSFEETYNLTKVMIESGDIIDLSNIKGIKVDKHSTGGVGDKTTLVVGPLAAACGVKIAKMSGRGLGFTGGTIDKLESIKNFNVNLSKEEFTTQVNNINIALSSQTGNLVPADKKIYALRDVTGTTNSIPLIASSIMSKKIASGSDKIILDVKVGKGAFMNNKEDAIKLSKLMIDIGRKFNRQVVAILTNMDYPLGYSIGNLLEVKEAINTLNSKGDERFTKLCLIISSYMVHLGKNIPLEDAFDLVLEKLENKDGLNKFYELVKYQKGDINSIIEIDDKYEIRSTKSGYLTDIDTLELAKVVNELGAGRKQKSDLIDYNVGIILNKKINDLVKENDILCYVFSKKYIDKENIKELFKITENKTILEDIVIDIIK